MKYHLMFNWNKAIFIRLNCSIESHSHSGRETCSEVHKLASLTVHQRAS